MGGLTIFCCPACKSEKIEAFMSYDLFPAIIFPVEASKFNSVSKAPLESSYCTECGHIFINKIDQDFIKKIYQDYYYLYPFKFLESMQEPYRIPFEKIADIFLTRKTASLLEIGCDDAEQMKSFIERGYKCTAINPGAAPSEEVQFIDGFYGCNTDVPGCFDYILSRFNLEHVIDLDAFFDALKKNLKHDGIVIVQVPNTAYFLNSGFLNVLAHEHVHYFCQRSILSIIKRHGLEVIYISNESNPSLICAFGRYNPPCRSAEKAMNNAATLQQINKLLACNQGKSVLFYGAGLSLSAILYTAAIERSLLSSVQIVDDNPVLKNRIMPDTRLQIQSLEDVDISSFAAVILTLNQYYHSKVQARIRAAGFSGSVFAIAEEGLIQLL